MCAFLDLEGEEFCIILPATDFLDDGCEHLTEMFVLFDEEDVDGKDVEADIGQVRSLTRLTIFERFEGNTNWPKSDITQFHGESRLYFLLNSYFPWG